MKQCAKCKEWKDESEFYKRKHGNRKGQLLLPCKSCQIERVVEHRKTERGKEIHRAASIKYYYSKKGQKSVEKRRKSGQIVSNGKKYDRSDKGKQKRKERDAQIRNKLRAGYAVNRAINRGELAHISTQQCDRCKNQAHHYHHPSYERENWLKVIPLCRQCHVNVHKEMTQ